jgi:SAM-dependent methyltransferase
MDRPRFARIQARAAAVEERKGGAEHRRRLLSGLTGRVIEIGAGSGVSFGYYPPTVTELVAVEPEPNLRARAQDAAPGAPIPIRVVDADGEHLPAADGSMDAAVVAGLLCSVEDPERTLTEVARVLRPGGELRFFEHVAGAGALGVVQRVLDATFWPRTFGGCRTHQATEAVIRDAGFRIERCERFRFHPTLLSRPVAPRILGQARHVGAE